MSRRAFGLLAAVMLLASGCFLTGTLQVDIRYPSDPAYRVTSYYFDRDYLVVDGYFTRAGYVDTVTIAIESRGSTVFHYYQVRSSVRAGEEYRMYLKTGSTRPSGRVVVTIKI